jgi:hypothetical protein
MIGHAPHTGPYQFGKKGTHLMDKQKSEVAQLLQQISLEYEAATRGSTGLSAGSAKHSFITARLEQIGIYHEHLTGMIGEMQATQLLIELAEQKQDDTTSC